MLNTGIDQSLTNTAIVVLNNSLEIKVMENYLDYPYQPEKTELSYNIKRLVSIQSFIRQHCPVASPVALEGYSLQSTGRLSCLAELGGVLKVMLHEYKLADLHVIPPSSLKLFATGYGFASKKEMLDMAKKDSKQLREVYPDNLTDDICDAYFLAKFMAYTHHTKEVMKGEENTDLLRHRLDYVKGVNYNV